MSESIDRRVVEMAFDAKDFLQNVGTTLTVLDKLKETLNFKGAGKNFESVSGLGGAVESVKNRFSALEIVGMTALVNLTNSAVNLGKQLARSLTVDQVRAGFAEYELKMNSIQTIMASTGKDIDTVNGYLNELNTYADKTIYSFSDMTSSIGKFTNAGVDLDTAVKAIQGISNEAAVSGANANEASRAMYNFAQALSAGYVKLIDWKSIENANMATKEFKQQLIDTAVEMGTLEKAADGTYKVLTKGAGGQGFKETMNATKNFNDSLSAAWMTTDVLTTTLGRYADETTKIGKKAFAAAQDVKTFSQLLDTVKESIGSGWAQTFELIFGNLEQAKELWTNVNNVISGFVNASSDARNALFSGWSHYTFSLQEANYWHKKLKESLIEYGDTARDVFLKSLGNVFRGFSNFLRPIRDAFRTVFSPLTSNQLVEFTTRFATFSEDFRRTMATLGRQLKLPFIDIFQAGKDVVDLFKDALSGLFDVITGGEGESATGSLILTFVDFVAWASRGVSALIDFGRKSGIFTIVHDLLMGVNNILSGLIDTANLFADSVTDAFEKIPAPVVHLGEAFDKLFEFVDEKKVKVFDLLASAIGKIFSLIGKGLSHINFGDIGKVLAGSGILIAGKKLADMLGTLQIKFDDILKIPKSLKSVKDSFKGLGQAMNEFQSMARTGRIMAIAGSLALLAYSCVKLSKVPIGKLSKALGAIATLFGELAGASWIIKGNTTKGIIKLSIAIVILTKAVKALSEVENIGQGLIGVGVLLGELTAFCLTFNKLKIKPKGIQKTAKGLILMAVAINLLAKPVKELGAMDTNQLIQGLAAIGTMLGSFALTALAFKKIKTKGLLDAGKAMVVMAVAMNLLVPPISALGSMDIKSLEKGLGGMAVALLEIAGFTAVMGKIAASSGNVMKASGALLVMSIGIKIMAGALDQMGANANAGQGLSVMFGSLLILAIAMKAMQNAVGGAAAMILAAAALAVMAPAIALLSSLPMVGVAVGMAALAGTLIIFGGLAKLLAPLTPVMLALTGALALLGVAVLGVGAGLMLMVAAFLMATGPVTKGAEKLAEAFPIIAKGIGEGIVVIIQTLGDTADAIKVSFLKIIDALLTVGKSAIPKLVTLGLELLVAFLAGIDRNVDRITTLGVSIITKFINALSAGLPDLVEAGFDLIISLLNSMADAISKNGDRLANALANVLLAALGAIVGLIPGFGKKGKAMIEEYRKGFEDKTAKGNLDKTSKKIASDTEKNLKVKDKYQDGRNITKGLDSGLSSYLPTLRTTAKKIADIVDSTVRKRNEIKSPSRRLARTGRYLMMGLISGVDGLTSEYQKKADNISTVMISSATNSANAVRDIMNTSFSNGFDLENSINKAIDVSFSMDKFTDRNAELNRNLALLTKSLDGVTDTMNSRQMITNVQVDGSDDPLLFADKLVRGMRLNARSM